jgi:tetratricopeptide (TPR) repeat protein
MNNKVSKSIVRSFNNALFLQNKGQFNDAVKIYREICLADPERFEFKLNLATSLYAVGEIEQAVEIFHKLHERLPENAVVLASCSACYSDLGHYEIALNFLKLLIKIDPNNITAWLNMTYISSILNKNEDALYYATQALSLNPNEPKLFNNMGSALQNYHRYEDSLICYDTALKLDPNNLFALTNTATVYDKLGQYEKSIEIFQSSLRLLDTESDEYRITCYRMSFPLLSIGDLKKGWEYYEYGFSVGEGKGRRPQRVFDKPKWNGQNIQNKTLLIWREQGIGDELWFYSLLNEVTKYCENIVVECEKRLITLLQRSFKNIRFREESNSLHFLSNEFDDFDVQIPAGSLFKLFRSDLYNFPKSSGYLVTDANSDKAFKDELLPYNNKLLIGVSWRSGLLDPTRNINYAPLSSWAEILRLENIQFVNLQYGDISQEINSLRDDFGIEILNFDTLDIKNDIDALASLVKNLDLVISNSSDVALSFS